MSRNNTSEYEHFQKMSQTLTDVSTLGRITLDRLHVAELANTVALFGWAANQEEWEYVEAFLLKVKAGANAFQDYLRLAGFAASSRYASLKAALKETKTDLRLRARAPPSTTEPFTRVDGVLAFFITAATEIRSCMHHIDDLRAAEHTRPLSRAEYIVLDECRQMLLRQTVAIEIVGGSLAKMASPSPRQQAREQALQRGIPLNLLPSLPATSLVDQFVLFELTSRLYRVRDPTTHFVTAPAPEQLIEGTEAPTGTPETGPRVGRKEGDTVISEMQATGGAAAEDAGHQPMEEGGGERRQI